jgi:hypothetical protein
MSKMVIHTYRTGDNTEKTGKLNRSTAIRLFCQECMGWQAHLVKECPSKTCELFPYRLGPGRIDAECVLESNLTTRNRIK